MEQEPICCDAGKTVCVLVDPCRASSTHPTTSSLPPGPYNIIAGQYLGSSDMRVLQTRMLTCVRVQCVPRTQISCDPGGWIPLQIPHRSQYDTVATRSMAADYIHRVGRTGRAGQAGRCLLGIWHRVCRRVILSLFLLL
jgi:hypothetical protein